MPTACDSRLLTVRLLPPAQLYNLNNPLRARSYWKTGIIMGIVHGIVIFLVVYYSAVGSPPVIALYTQCFCAECKCGMCHLKYSCPINS